ncbi:hypothetical protein B0T19DRAFT_298022 [Cercophora scortea]|uniref:FAD/NAD(P)-binding domain-containing protein n=1 Tax=Cercophora scortea TaxID=314031 RepID=A0AAE0I3W2_9PEZI|nr:hypothetical protein B0T19DRAFT_298022 [Cercophora scortea]
MSTTTHEIVVLGGNFGALGIVQSLTKFTIPSLQKLDKTKSYHITVITPNDSFYFKPAAPRAVIEPGLAEKKLIRPLTEAFKHFPEGQVKLVKGAAIALDAAKRTVTVGAGKTGLDIPEQTVPYDSLFIATGTTSASPLWSIHDDQSLTAKAFKELQEALPKAKTIIVAGGGPVGVETAGEILTNFPNVEITLYSGAADVLGRTKPEVRARAQAYLEKIKVKVVHNVKVVGHATTEAGTTVELSNGEKKTADLFIDATGGVPNSQFLPASWLDSTGRVLTRDTNWRVRGSSADDKDVKGLYVVGDVVADSDISPSNNSIIYLKAQVTSAVASFAVDVAQTLEVPKPGFLSSLPIIGGGSKAPVQKPFAPMPKDTHLVPIGKGFGVGQIMGWTIPSFLVTAAKGDFLQNMIEPYLAGHEYKA